MTLYNTVMSICTTCNTRPASDFAVWPDSCTQCSINADRAIARRPNRDDEGNICCRFGCRRCER